MLADATRVRLLWALLDEELPVTELPQALGKPAAGVQTHSTWHDPLTTSVRVYQHVHYADALHAQWAVADLGGRLHPLSATDYGLREAAYANPDGNLLRFGSPLVPT